MLLKSLLLILADGLILIVENRTSFESTFFEGIPGIIWTQRTGKWLRPGRQLQHSGKLQPTDAGIGDKKDSQAHAQ